MKNYTTFEIKLSKEEIRQERKARRANPCYKAKIMYHQNAINNLVNESMLGLNPEKLRGHVESLKHFVEKQAQIQETQIDKYTSENCTDTKLNDHTIETWNKTRIKQLEDRIYKLKANGNHLKNSKAIAYAEELLKQLK